MKTASFNLLLNPLTWGIVLLVAGGLFWQKQTAIAEEQANALQHFAEIEAKNSIGAVPAHPVQVIRNGTARTWFSCTAKNGFVFTAPSESDLTALCPE